MDALMTDQWLSPFIFGDQDEDEALSAAFDQAGYQSSCLIKNLGSTFLYMVLLMICLMIILPVSKLFKQKLIVKLSGYLESQFIWNGSFRFIF